MIHGHDLFESTDVAYIKNILGNKVVINIKVDQVAFVVMRDGFNIRFFGKDGRQEIDYLKRVSMDIYENGINTIQNARWDLLPDKHKIFIELFNDDVQTNISYSTKPRNDMIVSYIKDPNNNVILPNDKLNSIVAEILKIDPPPVLYSGFLSTFQQKMLMKIISMNKCVRKNYFSKDDSFLKVINLIFTPLDKLAWLSNDGYEGIVVYSEKENDIFKIVDPLFTQKIIIKKNDRLTLTEKKCIYLTVFDSIRKNFNEAFNDFKADHVSYEKAFVDFVFELTRLIIVNDKGNYNLLLNKKAFKIGIKHVPKMEKLIQYFWFAEDIFSITLYSLKGIKRINNSIGLTKEIKDEMNVYAEKVKTIKTKSKGFNPDDFMVKQKKEISLFIGRFQPLHGGHALVISEMKDKNKAICIINTDKRTGQNPFGSDYQKELFYKVFPDSNIKLMFSNQGFLPSIANELRKEGFEVTKFYAGLDRLKEYKKWSSKLFSDEMPEEKRFDIKFTMAPRYASGSNIRFSIENNDSDTFHEYMPEALHSEWNKMRKVILAIKEEAYNF